MRTVFENTEVIIRMTEELAHVEFKGVDPIHLDSYINDAETIVQDYLDDEGLNCEIQAGFVYNEADKYADGVTVPLNWL